MRSGVSPAGLPLKVQPLKSLQDPGVSSADADGLWVELATAPHAGSTQTPDVGNSLLEGGSTVETGVRVHTPTREGRRPQGPSGADGLQEGSCSL